LIFIIGAARLNHHILPLFTQHQLLVDLNQIRLAHLLQGGNYALFAIKAELATDAVVARHPDRPPRDASERAFWSASLDHAIWFHRPVRADAWHLHAFTCRGLIGSRGLSSGAVFDQGGRHVASVAQEVLIRPRRAD
jgi:hypothetical protein